MKKILLWITVMLCLSTCAFAQERDAVFLQIQNMQQAEAAYPDCTVVSSVCERDYLAMVLQQPDGRQALVCGVKNGAENPYTMQRSAPLPEGVQAEIEYAMENNTITLILKDENGLRLSGHSLAPYGKIWGVTMGDSDVGHFWVKTSRAPNGAWCFGSHPWSDISAIDWKTLPQQHGAVYDALDTQDWATPCSTDYRDRVHLRAAPRKDSVSLGKYYNGTPVKVLERGAEWTHVSIFGVEGYMMTEYLAFEKTMMDADNGLFRVYLYEESAALYSWPTVDAEQTVMTPPNGVMILAVVGEDWYHVWSTETGESGYMRVEDVNKGNG